MIKRMLAVALTCFAALTGYAQQQQQQARLVKDCFEAYKQAILQDNGTVAVEQLDSRTIGYYDGLLEKVKTADSLAMRSASFVDRIIVLYVRAAVSREEILQLDGKQLIGLAIKKGLVGKNGVVTATLGEVTIYKEFAKAECLSDGTPNSLFFHFYKEGGSWKLNLADLMPLANHAFAQVLKESGKTEDEFTGIILNAMTGKPPGNEVWQPVH